ncbi:MAG TPA: hypothetical protein VKR52_04770 [Terracidiphilus sp.]|nr:hypothetical protein [Terracidiphilus sp.]
MVIKPFVCTFFVVLISVLSSGCQDDRIPDLQQRVADLERKVRVIEAEKQKKDDADSLRQSHFEGCVQEADNNYQNRLELNGTKGRGGSYTVPIAILREMDEEKRGKLEECRLLYK